ncbi:MAG: hypothetical protein M1609_04310, partial [Firmicutes bacterium]|nr:hypothetical protein [Bacillota bacterium]
HLCYRNDDPGLMSAVAASGADMVRVWGPYEDIGRPSSRTEQALSKADKLHPWTLFVFAPTTLLPESQLRLKIHELISLHPGVTIELGNEPDVIAPGYQPWLPFAADGFTSFARFVRVALDEAVATNPDVSIGLGALGNVRYTPALLESLIRAGVPLSRLTFFGLHAYDTEDALNYRLSVVMPLLRRHVISPSIWLTEWGTGDKERQFQLPEMAVYANSVVSLACLHELGGQTPFAIGPAAPR